MLKKSAAAAALFFITVSSNIYALGLGAIDMRSSLNQPMNAVIELTSASASDLSDIKVFIASQQAHDRAGLSRARILSDFKFSVEQDNRGNAFVRITGSDAVHEPFLEFLLELEWPNGHLLREYTVLVDPPVTMPAQPVATAAPVSRTAAPAGQSTARQSRVPSRPVTTPVRTAAAPASSADSYGPVRRNETLWEIAKRTRPGNDISMDQMMHALLRENPQAFMNNNINRLKAGVTLNIPDRNTINTITASEALAESRRQEQEWKAAQQAAAQESEPQTATPVEAADTVDSTESLLQLTAPEEETTAGLATASSGDPEAVAGTSSTDMGKQLALVSEEAEASKAQSVELQSRVADLEEQIETMKRLLELKDDALAGMQDQVAADADELVVIDESETALETDVTDVDVDIEDAAAEEVIEDVVAQAEPEATVVDGARGFVNKLMDNPVLAGLGVLVAILLGGFLWASTRHKGHQSIFDDEMTLEKHMSNASAIKNAQQIPVVDFDDDVPEEEMAPLQGYDESDPITEADVYLAYGRIQQAEDVLQAALEHTPDNAELRVKLLEVYHAGGNISAFDREASEFRDSVTEDDARWLRVAVMGFALSPSNELYRAGADDSDKSGDMEFDMDLSGMDDTIDDMDSDAAASPNAAGMDQPDSIDFNLDDISEEIDEEDANEGLLDNEDEVATKLDLARAYMDMGDPEGARSILDEVMGEGNEEQKREAEDIIAKIG
jgi:pilus assembly protein FimV